MNTESINSESATNPPVIDATSVSVNAMNVPIVTDATAAAETANAKRLAELAEKIRSAYKSKAKCDAMVVDWKKKQLKAGFEMGQYLQEAKSLLPFSKFGNWCKISFPELSHRTLNRYMSIAKNEKHLTKVANSLRQAYNECSDSTRAPKSAQEADLHQIKSHLSKAIRLLNSNPDLPSCQEGDFVCDLVDAINIWTTDYRTRKDTTRLKEIQEVGFEFPMGSDTDEPTDDPSSETTVTE